jgi:hypothetical protein
LDAEKNPVPLFFMDGLRFSAKPATYRLLASPFPAGAIFGFRKPVRKTEFGGALPPSSILTNTQGMK